jgi:hypothetical protein
VDINMKKEPQIFTIIDDQNVPVSNNILDTLEQEEIREGIIREFVKELLTEQQVKFSGILKIMPSPEIISAIDSLLQTLPPEAVPMPADKWHVTLVHQGILKPFRKELKRLDKAGQLPPPPPVNIDPEVDHRVGIAPGMDMDRQSWVVWISNQGELAAYVNRVMELVGGPANPEPNRVFHISIANLTGNPGDSVR